MRLTVLFIAINLALAIGANAAGTTWAQAGLRINGTFLVTLVLSPLVFLTFGFVASRMGLAPASATIDTLLTIGSVLVGLVWFGEWSQMTPRHLAGLGLAISGVVLLHLPG